MNKTASILALLLAGCAIQPASLPVAIPPPPQASISSLARPTQPRAAAVAPAGFTVIIDMPDVTWSGMVELQSSPDMLDWQTVQMWGCPCGDDLSWQDDGTSPALYFRSIATPQ